MKKQAWSFALLITAAALSLAGCKDKVGSAEGNGSIFVENTTAAASESETLPEGYDEKPTDIVHDIQSTNDFKYEIIDGSAVITSYTGSATSVEVPDTIDGSPVTKIGNHAFEGKFRIKSITLPETITLIGESAFCDCEDLESINIPSAVTGIDRAAFASCLSLKELTIPASVQYIREEAFTACESMTVLNLENGDIAYENWGIEVLPDFKIFAPSGSPAAQWSAAMGK